MKSIVMVVGGENALDWGRGTEEGVVFAWSLMSMGQADELPPSMGWSAYVSN